MTSEPKKRGGEQSDPAEMGGDPPCWAGLVEDHRDHGADDGATPGEPPPVGSHRRIAELDLSTPTQVHYAVTAFYREIMLDELLEPVFGEVAEVDWAEHIPKLIDYWCWILFGTQGYTGAITRTHRHLHGLQPIEREHCDRWFSLWVRCVDERWSGPYAEHAKTHAAVLMAGMAKRLFGFTWVAPIPPSPGDPAVRRPDARPATAAVEALGQRA